MHGRPRKPLKPEDEAASVLKAEKLRVLQSQFLSNHNNKIYTKEALDVSAKLLEVNPESYTAWNYRKLAVEQYLSQPEPDPDTIKSIFNEELKVVESALRQNFKSYGAWHHRKWVLGKGHSSFDYELRLLDRFQKADSRNFHAWNYRRFVAELMNRSEEDELNYTTEMINTNFSNYSAWHNRSVLLSHLLNKKVEGFFPKEKVLNEEYDLVHQALFTDPDDQSGWFYYLWLLDQTVKTDNPHLVSTWPVHGYNVILSGNRNLDDQSLSPFESVHPDSGTFPLILYFDQAVEGVDSSTVSVQSAITRNRDLIWKPLPVTNSKASQVWVTHLSFPDEKLRCSNAYPVEVSLGHSQGTFSSTGSYYNHPTRFAFKVTVQVETILERKAEERISWTNENFSSYDENSPDSNSIIFFDRLSIDDDHCPSTSTWCAETIFNEISLFQELLSEINCKIGKLTLARLLTAHGAMLSPHAIIREAHYEEVLELYRDLIKLDPSHSHYYEEQYSLVLLQQVTSNRESMLRHCYEYRGLPTIANSICLRLNNLSISRVGSIEKLLWVQVLDLSNNELQSIEGLEAMQLLSCLNLSNNKLESFTALGPLTLLKSLKVLNLSYNEIGAHSIDTTRYLCASPLCHTKGIDWNPGEIVTDSIIVTNYWEAYLIFRDMNLTQLDIVGNKLDEKFKSFLVKVLPTLKWLDSAKLH